LVLSGTNTYVGPTVVAEGTLRVDGTITSNSVSVENGATLGGDGSASAPITVGAGATLAPGGSYGDLVAGNGVTFDPAATFEVEVGGLVAGISYDQLIVSAGDATLGGATLAIVDSPFSATYGDVLYIIDNQGAGSTIGTFNYADDSLVGGFGGRRWFITYDAVAGLGLAGLDGGNDVALYAVPEPASALFLATAGLLALRRRRGGERDSVRA
jgi:autotransporter-associated beta strand protein